ncbi:MotA/TolQ/ExbB proton channel family protein [Limnobacter humi]|uniref:MotA/TolQ/ExbB proton channel family protein n=1 Tax=Limnobacter humi TaxID=1778671 RepID=A0ABT1WGJ2_9BURK|nr:MotA/TolQ/ExbB proton channel family protein [Limnobacter humi]MCQ8896640.1 MotA/TolQ/ExbB proton channel family protein [Limnobacter humi]
MLAPHRPYSLFLQWLLITSITLFASAVTWNMGLFQWVVLTDNTRICAITIAVFAAGIALAGWRSWYLSQQANYFHRLQQGQGRFVPGQSFCFDYVVSHNPVGVASEGGLLAEIMAERARGTHQVGWFLCSLMLKLGLLGTIVGFVIMLGSLEGLEKLDINDIKTLMKQMTQGMGVAMNTTLVGLVTSMVLGIQFLLLDRFADHLIADTVAFAHRAPSVALAESTSATA